MVQINRRRLLVAGVGVAGVAAAGSSVAIAEAAATPRLRSNPFALGVASGDPLPTSVVLWTRLAPKPKVVGYGMDGQPDNLKVHWRIATTKARLDSLSTCADHGDLPAAKKNARSIHAIANKLAANTRYVYRFWYTEPSGRKWASAIGHTRTLPASGSTQGVRFVVSSCQSYGRPGDRKYFNGWRYLVDHAAALDVDFVVQIGDYIYADMKMDDGPNGGTCNSVRDYRLRYGHYRMRDNLQQIHQTKPFFCAPDDHEWWNNVHGGTAGLDGRSVEHFNAAVRAYWEHMPLRHKPVADKSGRLSLKLHRHVTWGKVLDLFLTDTRQHRTKPGSTSSQTILGAAQRRFLADGIRQSTGTWTAIATQVPMGEFGGADKWDGYRHDRAVVTGELGRARANGTKPNAVVLSGDIHCGVVARVKKEGGPALVATEFVGPAMTSQSDGGPSAGGLIDAVFKHNGKPENGFLLCHVTPSAWNATYYLGHQVSSEGGSIRKGPTWRAVPGKVGARRV